MYERYLFQSNGRDMVNLIHYYQSLEMQRDGVKSLINRGDSASVYSGYESSSLDSREGNYNIYNSFLLNFTIIHLYRRN